MRIYFRRRNLSESGPAAFSGETKTASGLIASPYVLGYRESRPHGGLITWTPEQSLQDTACCTQVSGGAPVCRAEHWTGKL